MANVAEEAPRDRIIDRVLQHIARVNRLLGQESVFFAPQRQRAFVVERIIVCRALGLVVVESRRPWCAREHSGLGVNESSFRDAENDPGSVVVDESADELLAVLEQELVRSEVGAHDQEQAQKTECAHMGEAHRSSLVKTGREAAPSWERGSTLSNSRTKRIREGWPRSSSRLPRNSRRLRAEALLGPESRPGVRARSTPGGVRLDRPLTLARAAANSP